MDRKKKVLNYKSQKKFKTFYRILSNKTYKLKEEEKKIN